MTQPDSDQPVNWALTTWEGSRREQLRRWAALPLDRVIAALEEMAELAQALGPRAPARDWVARSDDPPPRKTEESPGAD